MNEWTACPLQAQLSEDGKTIAHHGEAGRRDGIQISRRGSFQPWRPNMSGSAVAIGYVRSGAW